MYLLGIHQKRLREDHGYAWIKLAGELRDDLKKNKKIFEVAKSYKKDNRKQYNTMYENGNIIGTTTELKEKLATYFNRLLNISTEGNEEEYIYQFDRGNDMITCHEFENALKEMKNGKSPEYDNIPIELFKEGGDLAKQILFELTLSFWLQSTVIKDWGKDISVPFYKGKGDSGKCENYIGITFICYAAKLFKRILEKMVRHIIVPQLDEEQHGYRKDRSTSDLIFNLRLAIEKSWECNKPLCIAFIDLEKAFDSVPRNKLWRCLGEVYEIDGRLGAAIKSLYEPCMNNVRTGYKKENWFRVTQVLSRKTFFPHSCALHI
ncbi:uncharacterized protein [Palaemon carinicauda]|uniref:uncharacterized protein n=1 Tax=Palaemon carinicauda TaxID=392227 RepID=UPI0035B607FE